VSFARLGARIARLHPFTTRYASNLAILFGVVYFAQGMWHLPRQSLVIALKDGGLSAVEVAMFFSLSRIPWLIKPVYGLLSDSVPLFGRRRKSYVVLAALLASAAGATLAVAPEPSYRQLTALFILMALGLAFSDVLTDALMVEQGRPRGLTGAF
jgi:MFS family permease